MTAAIASLGFVGCQKEKLAESKNESLVTMSSQQNKFDVVSFQTNHGQIKVLKFSDWQTFDQTARSLQAQVDQLDDNFVSANAHLSERALNDLEETLNPNFEAPLDSFETQLEFTSYRTVFNTAMDNWLGHATLDFSKSPKNSTLFYGAELSLLNQHQQVMVGDSLYHFTGTEYAIVKGNYVDAIDFVLDNPSGTLFTGELSTVAWWVLGATPGCTLWKK